MGINKFPRWNLIALTLCAAIGFAACVPITIKIGAATPTPILTPAEALAATLTPETFPSLTPLATNTPTLTPLFFATSATPSLTPAVGVQPPAQQPPSQQPPAQQPPSQQPQPNPSACSGTPNITFAASRTTITAGESTILSWTVTNADSVQIDNGIGVVQASDSRARTLNTAGRIIFTLTARCGNNTVTKTVTVNVDGVGVGVPDAPAVLAAPAPPTNFSATGSGNLITFNWTDKSTNETGFIIRQQGDPTVAIQLPANTTSFVWNSRPCDLNDNFEVHAYNSAGRSVSNSAGAKTVLCAPENFSANGSGTTIRFSWNATANETGYRIYQEGGTAISGTLPPNSTQSSALYNCNTNARFFVRAINGAGESLPSNVKSAVTIPCAPTGLILYYRSNTEVGFRFNDNATNEDGYQVYKYDHNFRYGTCRPDNPCVSLLPTNFRIVHRCGQDWEYNVAAYNTAGSSLKSNSVFVDHGC